MSVEHDEPFVSAMGEAAYLCETRQPLDEAAQRRVWSLAEEVIRWPEVRDVVIGVNNLLVLLRPDVPDAVAEDLRRAWLAATTEPRAGRLVSIPVDYGGTFALDVAELIRSTGLPAEEIFRLHSGPEYTVFTIGSMPGFCYLSGLDPRLATPRRKVPRTRVEAGAVIIGGAQAGVMPISAPSGWHILGSTDVRLFDPAASPPVLLQPGDRVRFDIRSVLT